MHIIFNKSDLFKEKIVGRPLHKFFPSDICESDAKDYEKSVAFMKTKFVVEYNKSPGGSGLYPHITCAIDRNNCDSVFRDLKDSIFVSSVFSSGI